ncbi:MAG: hydroxymethylbilane synthase, partial [Planctomycetota bacterium]|nr:hydroxymethylbilane synthase [Planctomycetota bacterium]
IEDQTLQLTATVLSADGKQRLDQESSIQLGESPIESAEQLAKEVADGLRAAGAVELIQTSR